jgi:serine O-acetyltransferase
VIRTANKHVEYELHEMTFPSMTNTATAIGMGAGALFHPSGLASQGMKDLIIADYQRSYGRPASLIRVLRAYFVNPGFRATFLYRLANQAWRADHVWLGLAIAAYTVKITGADIQPGASVGAGLVIRHPVGIVVGTLVVIGANCTLLQGTTLGEKLTPGDDHASPVLGDGVTIGAGAVVVGGISIGSGAVIGANSVVVRDVPPGATAVGVPARLLSKSIGVPR